jgi:hypothetical protein
MSRGGKRKGAGRPTDKPNRERFQYKLDAEIAEQFVERACATRTRDLHALKRELREVVRSHCIKATVINNNEQYIS